MMLLSLMLNLRTAKITTGKLAICKNNLSVKNMTTNVLTVLLKAQCLRHKTEAKLQ